MLLIKNTIYLYHSTTNVILNEFKIKGNSGYGIYFAKDKNYSKKFGDITYKVKIQPENTLTFNDNEVAKKGFFNMTKEHYDNFIKNNYDSLAWFRKGVLTEFIVLKPEIIKEKEII